MKRDPKVPGWDGRKRARQSVRRSRASESAEGSRVARRSSSSSRVNLAPANGTLRVIALRANGRVRILGRFPETSAAVVPKLQRWANDRSVRRLELQKYESGEGWRRIWKQNRLPHDLGPLFAHEKG